MRTTTNLALTVWDSNSDTFDHTALAANWDKIDADYTRTRPANQVEVRTTVPASSNFEGRLVYLSAADSGFGAGTIIRFTGGSFRPVPGVELLAAVPTLGNFAGRIVLLTVASGSFAQWSLIRYDGTSWALANFTYELLSAVPSSGNFAGRLVMLTTANGGFNAYDLIRYNGSTWARIGPDPVYPGTELAYLSQTTSITTTNTVSPGDTIGTFSAATYENVKYYFDVYIPLFSHTVANASGGILLRESGSTVGSEIRIYGSSSLAGGPVTGFNYKVPFTPTAGSHTYSVTWYMLTAGTATMGLTGLSPALFRIIKA
jgi:hypothetical protein